MVRTIEPITVEVDAGKSNANLFFQPLGKPIRGRFGFIRTQIPDAMRLAQRFDGNDIPGMEIRIDPENGAAAILEPLHRPENKKIRERIEKDGSTIPPAEQEFTGIDTATWLFGCVAPLRAAWRELCPALFRRISARRNWNAPTVFRKRRGTKRRIESADWKVSWRN